ncbi:MULTISPECIES: putative metal-binding motif-containing protein [unclassified Corallococcus]|uniref:putative metal-binding motif-containing protein n=1 Tax=unclassified Corallococcus TaxID=2685029 RepID=UPI001A8D3D9F|nr:MULTISPECIES: putative metal-binding motif-containing protein [unclassified Corallococcus]WAS88948.1 putative metal-binding motif-containing protein [Corallococcus sp. NCRR]
MSLGPVSLVMALLLAGCDSSTKPPEPVPDAGTQVDAGVTDDAGTPDSGVAEALPCEKTQGVCAGAKRAMVDGAYEPVCTARSYGENYEATETRCDGLDNDCDGVTDPATWADVAPLGTPPHGGIVDSLPVAGGFLVVSVAGQDTVQIRRLDESLALQATTQVPVAPGAEPVTMARLVRTSHGPALVYVGRYTSPSSVSQGRLVQLDEQGNPVGTPGGVVVFEYPQVPVSAGVATSLDGQRLAVMWNVVTEDYRETQGLVVDADGKRLSGPWILFRTQEQVVLSKPTVLALEDGGFLAMVVEDHGPESPSRIQLWRNNSDLTSISEQRMLDVGNSPIAQLLSSAPGAGGTPGDPLLLYRETSVRPHQLKQVRSLFTGGAPATLATAAEGETPWFGATLTSRGLQMAWLGVRAVSPGTSGDDLFNWEGRFWTLGLNGIATDRSPGPGPMPLHRFAQWVLMHELPGHWMGALVMTSTNTPTEAHTLQSVRYCAP